jgi:hypothetical protein
MTHPRQAHSTSRAEEGDAGARRLPLPPRRDAGRYERCNRERTGGISTVDSHRHVTSSLSERLSGPVHEDEAAGHRWCAIRDSNPGPAEQESVGMVSGNVHSSTGQLTPHLASSVQ